MSDLATGLVHPRGLQRAALRALIASIVASAAMGVFALLVGEFEETQAKLLGTSLSVSGASVIAMACGFAWARGRLGPLPPVGIALGVAGFALVVAGMWPEVESEPYWKSTGTMLILAVAATHASVISPFGLARRSRWVLWAAYGLNAIFAALYIIAIWSEPDDDRYWRVTAAVAILLAAATIAIPVLRRLGEGAPSEPRTRPVEATHCPRCGRALAREGDEACPHCGARFHVEITAAGEHPTLAPAGRVDAPTESE